MTSFGDELRASLKKKSEHLLVRQMQEERQLQAAKRQQDETRRAVEGLFHEVFKPLLVEFQEVMETAGVLCAGSVEEEGFSHGLNTDETRKEAEGCPASDPERTPLASPIRVPSVPIRGSLCLRAMGTGPGSPHYEIRIACSVIEDRIEVAMHCVDRTAAEFGGNPPERALIELPAKSFKAQGIHHDAIRDWCAGLLKKCADACMEANRGGSA